MEGVKHRFIETNGINMHIAEQGSGPVVLLLHGFPSLWYMWRHQLQALADAGYHAIAPDQRGYGQTGGPDAEDQYTVMHLVGDVIGLLDALGQQQEPRGAERDFASVGTAATLKAFTCAFWDTRKGDIHQNCIAPKDKELSTVFYTGELPPWYKEEDLKYCAEQFEKTEFTGSLNWYRNIGRSFKLLAPWVNATVSTKSYYITGEDCTVNEFPGVSDAIRGPGFKRLVPNLRATAFIEDSGHFVLEEQPKAFNEKLLTFLAELQNEA